MEQAQTYHTYPVAIKEYEDIACIPTKARREANSKVIRLHMSGFQSYRTIKSSQIKLRLRNLPIKHKEDKSKVKLKTIYKISNTTVIRWWIILDLLAIIHKKIRS